MKTIEVSIKEFIVAISRRWLLIVFVGLIFTGVTSTLNYFGRQKAAIQENLSEKASIQDSIELIEGEIEELEKKKSSAGPDIAFIESVYSQVSTADIIVNTDIESTNFSEVYKASGNLIIGSELYDTIASYYIASLEQASYRDIVKELQIESIPEEMLRAIIQVDKENKKGVITIESSRLPANDGSLVEGSTIVDIFYKYFENIKQDVSASVGEHALSIANRSTVDRMADFWKEDLTYRNNAIKEFDNKIEILQDQKESKKSEILAVDQVFSSKKSNEIGDLITDLLMYFLIGVAGTTLIILVIYVVNLTVILPDQIFRQLGLRYLGGFKRLQGLLSSGLSNKLSSGLLHPNDTEAIDFISANLDEFAANFKRILFTGTISEKLIAEFTDKIRKVYLNSDTTLTFGGDINTSAETIRMLGQADCVVLVERQNVSKLRNVYRLKERIEISGKPIVGYVIF